MLKKGRCYNKQENLPEDTSYDAHLSCTFIRLYIHYMYICGIHFHKYYYKYYI